MSLPTPEPNGLPPVLSQLYGEETSPHCAAATAIVINGWRIFAHPLFLERVESLIERVEQLRQQHPQDYTKKNATKMLAAIIKLAFEVIPEDPTRTEYRQGTTLGDDYKHWFRAKFYQQYRLFFRYHQESKIIIYAWVNDERTKRAYDSKTDAYAVFAKMLATGNPPNDWHELLAEVELETSRLTGIVSPAEAVEKSP
jgi:toxin YhaV